MHWQHQILKILTWKHLLSYTSDWGTTVELISFCPNGLLNEQFMKSHLLQIDPFIVHLGYFATLTIFSSLSFYPYNSDDIFIPFSCIYSGLSEHEANLIYPV